MCAAPGSKTTQLLDMMGADPPGLLIANEREASRMHRLAARMQRQPCAPVLVASCEAQKLVCMRSLEPTFSSTAASSTTPSSTASPPSQPRLSTACPHWSQPALRMLTSQGEGRPPRFPKLKFDRILADVPCSGDGTTRKLGAAEFARWDVGPALSLHGLQLSILRRGLELLAPGGRLVYSTCSLNPIENEA